MDAYDEKNETDFFANTYIDKNIDNQKNDSISFNYSHSVEVNPDLVPQMDTSEGRKTFAKGCLAALALYFIACETGIWTGFDKKIGNKSKNKRMFL